jgi:hypothetical protein
MTVIISELANVSTMHAFYFYGASYKFSPYYITYQDNTVTDAQIICLTHINKTGNVTHYA